MVPVEYYFVLSALLFFIGVFGFITRRNLIAMLISVELVLNAVVQPSVRWLLQLSSMSTATSRAIVLTVLRI